MFSIVNFFSRPNVEKINRDLETKYVKKENASANSISHINNTSEKWPICNLPQRDIAANSSKLPVFSKNITISNQSDDSSLPPPLPPKPSLSSPIYEPPSYTSDRSGLLIRRKGADANLLRFKLEGPNEEVRFGKKRNVFLEAVKHCLNTDKYNEKVTKLFNNLESSKYNNDNYQFVYGARYSNELAYCKDTLIKVGDVVLPANKVSAFNSPYITIASQYPKNNKEDLNNYFNMLFDNNIDTVYVLASNDDIKKDLSKLGREYNRGDFENEGFKYFKENLELDDIKTKLTEKWIVKEGDKDKPTLPCKAYIQSMTKNSSNETKNIKIVHVYDWKDHTGIDATKLRNIIDIIGGNLKTKPTKENIVVHCLAGLGRTGEFIALMEMIKIIEAGNAEGKSLESIIFSLRENRSVRALYQPEQIAELIKYAINNHIPLINDDIK